MAEAGWSNNRNDTLLHCGVYLKRARPNDWKTEISRYNETYCKPPLPPEEVISIVRSLEKKDYEYLCKHAPMANHCNAMLCRARKFGVGVNGDRPRISGLRKVNVESPMWFMDMDEMTLELSTIQMLRYDQFQAAALAKGNHYYRSMKQDEWGQILNAALANVVIIEPSADLTAAGIFLSHLEDYLTNKRRGYQRDDLLSGRPWENEEEQRHYFSMKGLMEYLRRAGLRDVRETWVYARIRDLGGDNRFMNIKGKRANYWWVPSSCVSPTPTPDPPPLPTAPI
jgi:hypothetical protein